MSCRFRPLAPVAALLAALILLAGCAVNPATGRESFTGFMSKDDEKRVGAEEHPKLVKEFGGAYGDAAFRAYVTRIGLDLARHTETTDIAFTFTVLNDDKVNAFALPGGYVYITRGLLALAGNEAEMAGVLAHEIGHVIARHTAERYSTAMATNLGLMVFGVIGSAAGLPSGVGRLVNFGAQAALQSYSREQELEADMLGVRYLARAGYSPHAMTTFFEKMDAHARLESEMQGKGGAQPHNILSTHPRTAERIHQAIALASLTVVRDPVIGREEYLDAIDGMVFGDAPAQGVRSGRLFRHPDLGIRFEAPPGFQLFNSPRQVVGRGPDQALMVFDMASEKGAAEAGSAAAYLTGAWARGLQLRGVETIDINGMAAATGETRISTRDGPRDLRLIAIEGGPKRIFRLMFATPPQLTARFNVDLRRATYSFRRLSEAEAAEIRPLTVRVVTVKAGDTAASLARQMPLGRFSQAWFEVLNGLRPDQGLAPGTRVKVVGE